MLLFEADRVVRGVGEVEERGISAAGDSLLLLLEVLQEHQVRLLLGPVLQEAGALVARGVVGLSDRLREAGRHRGKAHWLESLDARRADPDAFRALTAGGGIHSPDLLLT